MDDGIIDSNHDRSRSYCYHGSNHSRSYCYDGSLVFQLMDASNSAHGSFGTAEEDDTSLPESDGTYHDIIESEEIIEDFHDDINEDIIGDSAGNGYFLDGSLIELPYRVILHQKQILMGLSRSKQEDPEKWKSTTATTGRCSSSRRLLPCNNRLFCVLLLATVCSIVFMFTLNHMEQTTKQIEQQPHNNNVIVETTSVTKERLNFAATRHKVMPISGRAPLFNASTHQYKALEWVVNNYNPLMEGPSVQETYVITLLHFLTGGSEWTTQNNFLNSSVSICDWHVGSSKGVYCNGNHSVNRLSLQQCNLQGRIPHELFYLSHMEHFYVHQNNLIGTIPREIISFHSLKMVHFVVDDNALSGTIPRKFHELTHLELFSAENNRLRGTLPSEFGTFRRLQTLNVKGNLIHGHIPTELGRISSLRELKLANNLLTGAVPSEFVNLDDLEKVQLSHNRISGNLDPIFCDSISANQTRSNDVYPNVLVVEADSCDSSTRGKVGCTCCCCTNCN